MTEVWATGISLPGVAVRMAQRAEADGFDGWFVVDSQNLAGDCYVALAQAAAATERIRLGTGVTNPYTRHPAVTASAIASVHAESGGRAVLGIGRGDSALAHLGLAPAPVDRVRALPRPGAGVPARRRGRLRRPGSARSWPTSARSGWPAGPTSSRLHWLPRRPAEGARHRGRHRTEGDRRRRPPRRPRHVRARRRPRAGRLGHRAGARGAARTSSSARSSTSCATTTSTRPERWPAAACRPSPAST